MGVWMRGLVLALGVLAGCVSDDDGYRSFPEIDRDYIEISISAGYPGWFSAPYGDWRIYSNDEVFSLIRTRNGNVLRREKVEGIYQSARGILNDTVLNELKRQEREIDELCRSEPDDPYVVTCIEPAADGRRYKLAAQINGERTRISDFFLQTRRGYSTSLFAVTFKKLETLLP